MSMQWEKESPFVRLGKSSIDICLFYFPQITINCSLQYRIWIFQFLFQRLCYMHFNSGSFLITENNLFLHLRICALTLSPPDKHQQEHPFSWTDWVYNSLSRGEHTPCQSMGHLYKRALERTLRFELWRVIWGQV